jgi:hypothetical protein
MHRSIAAAVVAVLAMALVLSVTYQAFLLFVPLIPQGISLGLVVLGLGLLCIVACAGVACIAHRWIRPSGYGRSAHGQRP